MKKLIAYYSRAGENYFSGARRTIAVGNTEKAAQLLAEKLSAAAPVRTGALAASIKAGAVKYSAADGYYCEVAPTGTSRAATT